MTRESATLWARKDMSGVYRELEHPADLLLEIRGGDISALFENALYALYDNTIELGGVQPLQEWSCEVTAPGVAETLRLLLAEALYHFASEGFVGAAAAVTLECGSVECGSGGPLEAGSARPGVTARAYLLGEALDRSRHGLPAEIKAVTYHLLETTQELNGAWVAHVLLDV